MKDFKYNNNPGGGNRGGDRGGDRGGFGGGNRFGKRDWNGPKEMHKAVCAKCGKTCEVPFRPSGDRPVYCHDCFDKPKSNTPTGNFPRKEGDSFPRREFTSTPSVRSDMNGSNSQMQDIKRQLDTVISKLDRLLQRISDSKHEITPASTAKEALSEIVASVLKAPAKTTEKTKKRAGKKTTSKKK